MRGEEVSVLAPSDARDAFGRTAPDRWDVEADVSNCLFAPSTTVTGSTDTGRGDSVQAIMHFPKAFSGSLANRRVRRANGSVWEVVGDPQPFPDGLCPTEWNRQAMLRRVGGEQDGEEGQL